MPRNAAGIAAADVDIDSDEVLRITGGNPFFVTEIARGGPYQLPVNVAEAVQARVQTLTTRARHAVDLLAAVGPSRALAIAHGQHLGTREARLAGAPQHEYLGLRRGEVEGDHGDNPSHYSFVITAEGAADQLQHHLATGTCATALGIGSRVLELTAAYTAEREQFGFPVATFQAVAMQTADRYIDLRAMEATLWQAAWRPEPTEVAVAKIWAAEGVRRVVQTAQHLHGGLGTDTEHVLHRFHAWAKQVELALGPAAAHEAALGALLART